MPAHDIIDNQDEKLVDHINQILQSTDAAKFAVGYFFLSSLESIAKNLDGVSSLRLLIGNTTDRGGGKRFRRAATRGGRMSGRTKTTTPATLAREPRGLLSPGWDLCESLVRISFAGTRRVN